MSAPTVLPTVRTLFAATALAVSALAAAPAAASEPADVVRYPYVAALSRVTDENRVYFCAGTLVAPRWIVTAAHCFHTRAGDRIPERDLWAAVGQARLRAAGDGVQVRVERVLVHPAYDPGSQQDDLALVELADPAGPLIADPSRSAPPASAMALGFGSFYEGRLAASALSSAGRPAAQLSDRLSRAPMRLVDPSRCASLGPVDRWTLCGSADPEDACVSDSGGPLVAEAAEGPDRLIGIASLGSGCAVADPVVLYTPVEPYAAWIAVTIAEQGAGRK